MSFPQTVYTNQTAIGALANAAQSAGLSVSGLGEVEACASVLANLLNTVVASAASIATTITATTSATSRLTQSEVTITPTTTFSVTGGGSIAGTRGGVTVTAGKAFTDGFLYGSQGKVTLAGTMNEGSAARIAGVLGQVDLASGTVTKGQVSCLWGDLQATSPTLTDPSQINIIRATNSTSSTVNAMLMNYGKASYFMTCGADGAAPAYIAATSPSTFAKSLKISIQGTDYWIPLGTTAS